MLKHYFIVNPVSGGGQKEQIIRKIKSEMAEFSAEYEIVITQYARHATKIVREIAARGERCRVFASGGDGTLFDVVNGSFGYDNVEVGVLPFGSGNDYVKNYGKKEDFLNISAQIKGESIPVDLMKWDDKYCINIASVGMDAHVARRKDNMKFLSKVSGKFAYIAAVFLTFIFNMNNRFEVRIDEGEPIIRDFLFVVAAKGKHYGGSFNPTPNADVGDGMIDVLTLNAVRRYKVITMLTKYQKGLHLDIPNLCQNVKAKRVRVKAERETPVNLDGEIFMSREVDFEVVEKGVRFILPRT